MRRKPAKINLLIGVDKPLGITSHDAVARVRRALDERRVGHAGTLDPQATGVMIIGVGQATRLLGQLAQDRKAYVARIAFGCETMTDDAEGAVRVRAAVPDQLLDRAYAARLLAGFVGAQDQVPPAYSAISVDGERSYKRARAGEPVELEPRRVEIYTAQLIDVEPGDCGPVWTVGFEVSKGTYIRALARDIGRAAGSAAHAAGLVRTASGPVGLNRCLALDEVSPLTVSERALDPVACLGVPALEIAQEALEDVHCGRALALDRVRPRGDAQLPDDGASAGLVCAGELVAVARRADGCLRMRQVFVQGIGGVA